MSNAQFRTEAPAFDYDALSRAMADGMRAISRELYLAHGGAEIDSAIALLKAFADEGVHYARLLMQAESLEKEREIAQAKADANAMADAAKKPDETKLPPGSEARKLVGKARRTRPVMDANAAARVAMQLTNMARLRQTMLIQIGDQVKEHVTMLVGDRAPQDVKPDAIFRFARLDLGLL